MMVKGKNLGGFRGVMLLGVVAIAFVVRRANAKAGKKQRLMKRRNAL